MAIIVEHANIQHVLASVNPQIPIQSNWRIVFNTRTCNVYTGSNDLFKCISDFVLNWSDENYVGSILMAICYKILMPVMH